MIGFIGTRCKGPRGTYPHFLEPAPPTQKLLVRRDLRVVTEFPYRIFTLDEANRAVPRVARLTARVQERLTALRRGYDENDPLAGREFERETRELLQQWQDAVRQIGAAPKGIFTVDFRSPDLNVLWCWTESESEISHRHYTWESFKDRVQLEATRRRWPSSN